VYERFSPMELPADTSPTPASFFNLSISSI
jgi:hypothetical protein